MDEKRDKPQSSTPDKNTRSLKTRVCILMAVFGVLMFVPLAMKLYDIQIIKHEDLEKKAINQQTRRGDVTANRGSIYDRNLNTLASSGSAETVGIDPPNIESEEQARLIAQGLSDILGLDYDWVYEKTTHKKTSNMTIAVKIDKEKADAIRKLIADNKLQRMIKLEPDSKRYYTYSNLASHVLGFVGRDNSGLNGLEALYNEVLSGTPGYTLSSTDKLGRIMPDQYEMYYDAQDGDGLVLTLDENIQHILERNIETALLENEVGNRACAIAMDVKTGAVLGMTTKGDFDPNEYQEIYDEATRAYLETLEDGQKQTETSLAQQLQWRNKAISDTYEPGSTFKIITTAIAVETGSIDFEKDRFQCNGIVRNVGGYDISCHKKTGHGSQTFAEALQNSCNPAFIAIAQKIGPEKFYAYMKEFGFMEKTGVDLVGEASNKGLYHTWETFSTQISTQATYAFGQTFKITPIQLITAVSAVANGGYLMEPYVVADAIDHNGVRQAINTPTVVRQVISQETSKTLRNMLEDAVKLGTGKNANVTGYRIAGKTGTSQKKDLYDDKGNYIGDGKYVVSFVGFAPADDPQVAVLVMLDEPGRDRNLRSGGYMAAPVAGRIFADLLPYLGIAPHYTAEELSAIDIQIPEITGLSLTAAKDLLKNKSVSYEVIGGGDTVLGQLPLAGVYLPATAKMLIYTEEQTQHEEVVMPNVIGMTPEKVNQTLSNAGLFMRATGAQPKTGEVIRSAFQTVEAGKKIPFGTIVDIEFRNDSVSDGGDWVKR